MVGSQILELEVSSVICIFVFAYQLYPNLPQGSAFLPGTGNRLLESVGKNVDVVLKILHPLPFHSFPAV